MGAKIEVVKGDSSNLLKIVHIVENVEVSDYSQYDLVAVILHNETKEPTSVSIEATKDNTTGFCIGVKPAQSTALGVGKYILVADLMKTVDSEIVFNRELVWPLIVTRSLRD